MTTATPPPYLLVLIVLMHRFFGRYCFSQYTVDHFFHHDIVIAYINIPAFVKNIKVFFSRKSTTKTVNIMGHKYRPPELMKQTAGFFHNEYESMKQCSYVRKKRVRRFPSNIYSAREMLPFNPSLAFLQASQEISYGK